MEVVLVKTEAESPEWEGLVSLPELEEDPLDIERWLTEHQLSSGQDDGSHDDRALLFGNNADLISDFIKTEYQFDTGQSLHLIYNIPSPYPNTLCIGTLGSVSQKNTISINLDTLCTIKSSSEEYRVVLTEKNILSFILYVFL
jgi:hypothetical protein